MIVRNNHFLNLTDGALARIGGLLEDLTDENAELHVHNPTLKLLQYIQGLSNEDLCKAVFDCEEITNGFTLEEVSSKIGRVKAAIYGQDEALNAIGKSLAYLSVSNRDRPFVMMLYGNTSLGKTETAKAIAREFFGSKVIEKHMSMFATTGYYNYLYGDKPNDSSLGYDLMQRESNLLFLDEIDKCPEAFHAALVVGTVAGHTTT